MTQQQAITAILTALVPLIVALLAYAQTLVQQSQINRNAALGAKHEEQLNGAMTGRIQSQVNAGPIPPTLAQRDMPTVGLVPPQQPPRDGPPSTGH